MHTVLHADPDSTLSALTRLGLTETALIAAAMQGYMARTNCTANHPPLFAAFVAWGETVRALREQLVPMGWRRNDENNYSRITHPDGHVELAVATGNESTGVASASPMTKSVKGPNTIDAVAANRLQIWLPGMEPAPSSADDSEAKATTWLLLIHHAPDEIRAELSLPVEIGTDGRINGWRERILLRCVPLDPEPLAITPPALPDLNVEVRRKA